MSDRRDNAPPGLTSLQRHLVSAVLIGVPVIALLAVPLYARETPMVGALPMFYWWTFLWIALVAVGTYASFRLLETGDEDEEVG